MAMPSMNDAYWRLILSDEKKSSYERAVHTINKDLNALVHIDVPDIVQDDIHRSDLAGIPFAIKDNIAQQDTQLTCGSRLLKEFISPFTATAVAQLLQSGFVPVGRTNMDEFGMGSSTIHSIYGRTNNPWDINRTSGGSSGGSAAAVASGMVPFALGSDTGGSVRQPAAFCGVWALKPTYGAVSRYGLVAYSSSLDVIGVIAEHPKWLYKVFNSMRVQGNDIHDASSFYPESNAIPSKEVKNIAVYIPSTGMSDAIVQGMKHAVARYKEAGYNVTEIDMSLFDYSPAVYMSINSAEASANLARFDGIRYGNRGGFADDRMELIKTARRKGFGQEVKTRMLVGGFVLRSRFHDQYYDKARQLRLHIRNVLLNMFTEYDLLVLPVFPTQAFLFGGEDIDEFQQKLGDTYSVVANLAGIPAVSAPVDWINDLPVGIQLLAPHYAEQRLCSFVEHTASLFEHKYSKYAKDFFAATARGIVN